MTSSLSTTSYKSNFQFERVSSSMHINFPFDYFIQCHVNVIIFPSCPSSLQTYNKHRKLIVTTTKTSSNAVCLLTCVLLCFDGTNDPCSAKVLNTRVGRNLITLSSLWFFEWYNLLVDEHQQSGSSVDNSSSLKHGNGSGGKFLSVPGKQNIGNEMHEN